MAVIVKSPQHIARLRESGRLVAEAYELLRERIAPGVTTGELDRIVDEFITRRGAKAVYKGYRPATWNRGRPVRQAFPASICVAINDVICHGIPSDRQRLKEGDIIGIDIGVIYNGWVGDACVTFPVGAVDARSRTLLQVAEHSLHLAIQQARPGNHLGDIGAAIQTYAEGLGYGVVKDFVGHGVGRTLHEDPNVPHAAEAGSGLEIKPGMVFTIEPMINLGTAKTRVLPDGWTVCTADGSRSAQFEHQLAITEDGPEILTRL